METLELKNKEHIELHEGTATSIDRRRFGDLDEFWAEFSVVPHPEMPVTCTILEVE